MQFALSVGYALPVIASLLRPSSDLARLVAIWNRLLQPAMRPIFEAIGPPSCRGGVDLYQAHVRFQVVDAIIATACYVACTPFWGAWAARLRRLPRWAQATPERREADLETVIYSLACFTAAFGAARAPKADGPF